MEARQPGRAGLTVQVGELEARQGCGHGDREKGHGRGGGAEWTLVCEAE